MLGFLGGIYGLMKGVTQMVIGGLVHTMFIGSVISKLYQVDAVEYDKTKYFQLFLFAID